MVNGTRYVIEQTRPRRSKSPLLYDDYISDGLNMLSYQISQECFPKGFLGALLSGFPRTAIDIVETKLCNNGFPDTEKYPEIRHSFEFIFSEVCTILYRIRRNPRDSVSENICRINNRLLLLRKTACYKTFFLERYFSNHNSLRAKRGFEPVEQ